MKIRSVLTKSMLPLLILGAINAVQAGAEHYQWQFDGVDYNNCTEELVTWDAWVRQTVNIKETPSGKVLFFDHWVWDGTIYGHDSGYEWSSKGVVNYMERFSTNGDLVGGFMLLENSVLKPLTPGAPRIKLDVHIRMAFNANGDLVVDRVNYSYNCL